MSVPEQRKADPPSVKNSFTTDFLPVAIALSIIGSPLEHIVEIVQAAAAFSNGESVKWTMLSTATASADGSTGLKSSTTCAAPLVKGVHALTASRGTTALPATR